MNGKYTFKDIFFKGSIKYNPILIQCVGLCPVVAATTIKNALILSAFLLTELVIICFIASALLKNVPRHIRVVIYFILGIAMICPALAYIDSTNILSLDFGMKVYFPLIAINSVTAVHCEQFSVKNSVSSALYDAFSAGFGTSIVLIIVGLLRELIGLGTVFDVKLPLPIHLSGISMPFGCLIILGFLAATLKAVTTKREDPTEVEREHTEYELPNTDTRMESEQIDNLKEVEIDFLDNDDEYLDLLSSVDELIEKFSDEKGGSEK